MVAGHLKERNGKYCINLSWYENKKRKTKLIATGITVKGNHKKANEMLAKARALFSITEKDNEEYLINFKNLLGIEIKEKEKLIILKNNGNIEQEVSGKMLFSDFLIRWLMKVKNEIKPNTYSGYYNNIYKRIVPYFQGKEILLKDLKAKDIQIFYEYVKAKYGIKNNTILRYHANIRKALQYALKMEYITCNPADIVERPKKNNFIGSFYSQEELKELLKASKGDLMEIPILLAAYYGLRRGEIVGLKWSDIDFVDNSITIRHVATELNINGKREVIIQNNPKTKSSYRILPLAENIKNILLNLKNSQILYRKLFKKDYNNNYLDFVCVNKDGNLIKPEFITHHFQILLQNNDLKKIRFHDLRHSCASFLFENNMREKEIQQWLGHSDISTTMNIYTHLREKPKKELTNIMDKILT